jgi:hypothetical protein
LKKAVTAAATPQCWDPEALYLKAVRYVQHMSALELNRPQMPRFEKTFARPRRPLTSRAREALELLASDPHGATEAFMQGHGFSLRTLVGLVHARLATVQREIVIAGGERVVATRIKITDAGRKAIG